MQRLNDYFPIDCTKVVMAILVVCVHTEANRYFSDTACYFLNIRMPLFFMFSGFFFAPGFKLGRSLRHLLPMLALYTALSWPLLKFNYAGVPPFEAIKRLIFSGTYSVTWFVVALMWCMAIVAAFNRLIKNTPLRLTLLLTLSIFLYILALSVEPYHSLLDATWIGPVSRTYKQIFASIFWSFPRGLLLFAIGAIFRKYNLRFPLPAAALLTLAGLTIFTAELMIDRQIGIPVMQISATLPIATLSVFALILAFCRPSNTWKVGALCRQYSTMLYFIHPMMIFTLGHLGMTSGMLLWVVTVILFSPIFLIYLKLRNIRGFHWLRYAA